MSVGGVLLSPIRNESLQSPGYCKRVLGLCPSESILIYLTVEGSMIPIRVLESDSIASVKLRIQTCKGFVVKEQKLVYGGRELARNDSRVKDYGVTDGNVLHLVLKLSDLLLITVRTTCGKELEFQVARFRNVAYLKKRIVIGGKGFVDDDDQELFYNGERLEDQRLIDNICKDENAVIHLLIQRTAKIRTKPVEKDVELSIVAANVEEGRCKVDSEEENAKEDDLVFKGQSPIKGFLLEPAVFSPKTNFPSYIWNMINATLDGLERGNQPIRSSEGTGGAYFMQNSSGNEYVSVFKPIDEEPLAVNNPRGLPVSSDGEGLKKGTRVGEGALREAVAFVLDHPKSGRGSLRGKMMGFAGVPPTILVHCLHEGFNHPNGYDSTLKNVKTGSLQMYMENSGSCEDMGPGTFPVKEVHKITVLDIRMANTDRHAGNILVSKGENDKTVLIPIDHGYCLPVNFEDCTFDWLYWPQARQPYSAEIIEYIKTLDAEEDIALLKFYGWDMPVECAQTLRISTMLLKKGVEKGLTPFSIGSIMCRETVDKVSMIEEIISEAKDSLLPGMSEAAFLKSISHIMDARLDKLAK